MKTANALWPIFLASAFSSCGTCITRNNIRPARPVGAYPFAAVWTDGIMIGHMFSGRVALPSFDMSGVESALLGVVSLPIDLVLDTVLLPADLVGWAFGARRNMEPPWR